MTTMANHWCAVGWPVTLLTYDDGVEPPAYDLDSAVLLRPLGIAGRSSNLLHSVASNVIRLVTLRRAIRDSEPEVVISFLDTVNVRTLLACVGLGFPIIVSERVDPAHHSIGTAWSALRRVCYRWATGVVTHTGSALAFFSDEIRRRGYVIPNPISLSDYRMSAGTAVRERVVLGMGRLTHQKGFDLLLRAFAIVATKHVEWKLVVWGEGHLREELEELRDELGLQGRAVFPGWTAEPCGEMRRAGIFVLSSRYEGFGMVLAEAMACGLAVVSYDCPSGPTEIVRHELDGLLVPSGNVVALAGAMDRLLSDEAERNRLGSRATEVTTRFAKSTVMRKWESLLRDAVTHASSHASRSD